VDGDGYKRDLKEGYPQGFFKGVEIVRVVHRRFTTISPLVHRGLLKENPFAPKVSMTYTQSCPSLLLLLLYFYNNIEK
jgi:hypothetical protein